VYNLLGSTQFTLDLTTPMEGAGTSFDNNNFLCPIATPTTHQITAIDTQRGVIALTSMCAQNALPQVLLTEAGRWLQIDNILGTWRFVLWIVWIQLEVISASKRIKMGKEVS